MADSYEKAHQTCTECGQTIFRREYIVVGRLEFEENQISRIWAGSCDEAQKKFTALIVKQYPQSELGLIYIDMVSHYENGRIEIDYFSP